MEAASLWLRCREELKGRHSGYPLDELSDDARVVSLSGIGAPVVGVEKKRAKSV